VTRGLAAALALLAAATDMPAAAADDPLAPLRFLAGACWRAEFPGGGLADVQCVEEMPGGFLRSRHAVFGTEPEYSGDTVYFPDAETGTARFIYFTSLGGVSSGSVIEQGGLFVFPDQRHISASGEELRLHGTWEVLSADAFRSESRRWANGAWSEPFTITFTRLPAACRTLEQVRAGCVDEPS
jgi:hypothetical protein